VKGGLAIVVCILFAFLLSTVTACRQRQTANGPTASEQRAFAATVVGTYGVKPDPSFAPISPPPKVTLSPDGTFSMSSIPAEWLKGYAAPSERAFSADGKWTVGDDGDGSWEIVFDVSHVSGKAISKRLRLRPFTQSETGLFFDNSGTPSVSFIRISG
jgi:hypothetical protein